MLEVAGRPVLSWVMDRVLALPDITDAVVVSNARFAAQFRAWRDAYQPPIPTTILDDGATNDDNKRGALADLALAMAAPDTSGAPSPDDDDLIVLAGDNLMQFDLAPYAAVFAARRAPMLLCRKIEGRVPPGRHGEVCVDADGVVTSFREKPPDPRSDLAATCLYFFPPGVRAELTAYLSAESNHDAPGNFVAWLAQRRPVHAMPIRGRLFDIGNRESLELARAEYRADL